MEELVLANKCIKVAHDKVEIDYNKLIEELNSEEKGLADHLEKVSTKINDSTEEYGNVDAADHDVLEINVGGKIIIAKRSTLTQHTMGTRFAALFNGRWDKKLQRDMNGRIFLDINPECFQAIIAYLNEMMISSEENLPDPPSVDDEHKSILWHQHELFGLCRKIGARAPQSQVLSTEDERSKLRSWLNKQGLFEELHLLYSGERDGLNTKSFRKKCTAEDCVIFIIKTVFISSTYDYNDEDVSKTETETSAGVYNANEPFIGLLGRSSHEKILFSDSSRSTLLGEVTTEDPGYYGSQNSCSIIQLEAFKATGSLTAPTPKATDTRKPITRFSNDINKVINKKRACLPKAELKICALEDSFKDEQMFIDKFALGDAKDIVTLNVSGTLMVTRRTTLCIIKDSVLAQQFDDSKWTEQAYSGSRVKNWSPDEVSAWAKNIEGIQENVYSVFKQNKITGCELLALNMDGLKMLGIERAGTLCLLKKEIETLEKASHAVTLIDHCPYCFGKILDYLRLKQAYSLGLTSEPKAPEVVDVQKKRFEKVVKFYFPGDTAKLLLG